VVAETTGEPYHTPLEDAADYFAALECAPGQNYQVHRIEGWDDWGTWYTYTNSLLVNDTVIVPGYASGDDQAARQVYQAALPGHTVVTVNSDDSIWSGGAIHCVAKELPEVASAQCSVPADCDLANVGVHACTDGRCEIVSCDTGFADCDGHAHDGCEIPLGTVSDCASCGDACAYPHAQGACTGGACEMGACDAGYADCDADDADGCETQLGTVTDCAGCGDACAYDHAAALCQAGACRMGACQNGYGDCTASDADGCETTLGTTSDCASCGDACVFDHASGDCQAGACRLGDCDAGFGNCNGLHSDGCETELGTLTDCAGCGDACAYDNAEAACDAGTCRMADCHAGWADCAGGDADGCETPLGTVDDCGACGDACVYDHAPGTCEDGSCRMRGCQAGWADCNQDPADGCETEIGTVEDCAACGDVCSFDHATAECHNGLCRIAACEDGFEDCNHLDGDGCEAELGTADHCAGCDDACLFDHAEGICQGGACRLGDCQEGYEDCNRTEDDGCETYLRNELNCGACGNACAAGETCRPQGDEYACGAPCPDADQDGHEDATCGGADCDDADRDVHPDAVESCNDVDDDCDGETDEGDVCEEPEKGCGCGGAPASSLLVGWLLLLIGRRRR
jgi:hypothetical protein